jgi:hypothetical protein
LGKSFGIEELHGPRSGWDGLTVHSLCDGFDACQTLFRSRSRPKFDRFQALVLIAVFQTDFSTSGGAQAEAGANADIS